MKSFVERGWYGGDKRWWFLLIFFLPISALFYFIAMVRRLWLNRTALPLTAAPVIVVGNISLGGTGKTPLLAALIQLLRLKGWTPGVVSRGYGGAADSYPILVTQDTSPSLCGDEPKLLVDKTGVALVVDPNRARAVRFLLAQTNCDVVLSDDGLQHYALRRDIEIAVVDGQRGVGNGFLFPAGPLREPSSRLKNVDFRVLNIAGPVSPSLSFLGSDFVEMCMESAALVHLRTQKKVPLARLESASCWQVFCGIGNPKRFFHTLDQLGITYQPHVFPDHHDYRVEDFSVAVEAYVLMTEKDAVKCQSFARDNWYYLSVEAHLPEGFIDSLDALLLKAKAKKDRLPL